MVTSVGANRDWTQNSFPGMAIVLKTAKPDLEDKESANDRATHRESIV